jgi:hypothetical protein
VRRGFVLVATGTLIKALCIWPATSAEMQPGLWELTSKVYRDGTVLARSPRFRCITAEIASAARANTDFDLSAGAKAMLSARFGQDACKLTDAKNSENLITWRLRCTGNRSTEQEGTVRFDNPRHYTLTVRTSMTAGDKTVASVLTAEGQHKGECPR